MYRPVPLEQKSPALARVIEKIASGYFGDGSAYQPYVPGNDSTRYLGKLNHHRLLSTILQHDYYLITDDFDSCTRHAFCSISISYSSQTLKLLKWLMKHTWIRMNGLKSRSELSQRFARPVFSVMLFMIDDRPCRWASSAPTELSMNMPNPTGTLNRRLCRAIRSVNTEKKDSQ